LRQSGNLPFTGLSAVYFAIAGALLLTAGLVLRRGGSLPEDDEGVDRSRA
jgi:hypothetical protein